MNQSTECDKTFCKKGDEDNQLVNNSTTQLSMADLIKEDPQPKKTKKSIYIHTYIVNYTYIHNILFDL